MKLHNNVKFKVNQVLGYGNKELWFLEKEPWLYRGMAHKSDLWLYNYNCARIVCVK